MAQFVWGKTLPHTNWVIIKKIFHVANLHLYIVYITAADDFQINNKDVGWCHFDFQINSKDVGVKALWAYHDIKQIMDRRRILFLILSEFKQIN